MSVHRNVSLVSQLVISQRDQEMHIFILYFMTFKDNQLKSDFLKKIHETIMVSLQASYDLGLQLMTSGHEGGTKDRTDLRWFRGVQPV